MKYPVPLWNNDPCRPISDSEADYLSNFGGSRAWAPMVKGIHEGKTFKEIAAEIEHSAYGLTAAFLVRTTANMERRARNLRNVRLRPLDEIIARVDQANTELEEVNRRVARLSEQLARAKSAQERLRRFIAPFAHVCKRCP